MSSHVEVRFPEDQQEGTEAVLSRWLKEPGDSVAAHEPVAEVETDKVVVEVPAPVAGIMGEIRVKAGEQAHPGDVLCTLLSGAGNAGGATVPDVSGSSERMPAQSVIHDPSARLSPAVRVRLMEHSLDPAQITGTGRDGRITLQDVEQHLRERLGGTMPEPLQAPTAPRSPESDAQIIPHASMRKRIAENMVASLLHTAPHVTAVFEADLAAVMRHRKAHRESFEGSGAPLTLTAYFVAAAVSAMHKVPQVNSRWHEDHLEVFEDIHVGIGTALGDEGLIVPVLRGAGQMDLAAIAAGLADLTSRARSGKLKPEDVRGGTFTVSNHGVSGSLLATPIVINQPQSAILGIGKIEKRVKVMEVGGEDVLAIRPTCYVSLTIDHRVLDGHQTNAWLTELVSVLENWKT